MGKNKRRIVLHVTPQTAYNLQRLADMDKTSPGKVVDKPVMDRMIEFRGGCKAWIEILGLRCWATTRRRSG